jgi:hypothetical protein
MGFCGVDKTQMPLADRHATTDQESMTLHSYPITVILAFEFASSIPRQAVL